MSFLRFVAIVALALWIGGLVALGAIAAPTVFDVLSAQNSVAGTMTAGVVFGEMFERFQHVCWGLGGGVALSLALRAALGPRPRRLSWRLWTTVAMLAVSVASVEIIAPRIDAIRASVPVPMATLAAGDARAAEFGRLHGLSNGLMLLTLLGGAVLLWTEMRDLERSAT
jgi:hypothetical protein